MHEKLGRKSFESDPPKFHSRISADGSNYLAGRHSQRSCCALAAHTAHRHVVHTGQWQLPVACISFRRVQSFFWRPIILMLAGHSLKSIGPLVQRCWSQPQQEQPPQHASTRLLQPPKDLYQWMASGCLGKGI